MPNQNNVELFLKITYCKRNLSRQFAKDPMTGVTCASYNTQVSRLLDLLNLEKVRPV